MQQHEHWVSAAAAAAAAAAAFQLVQDALSHLSLAFTPFDMLLAAGCTVPKV
jgi:hypothetical protein